MAYVGKVSKIEHFDVGKVLKNRVFDVGKVLKNLDFDVGKVYIKTEETPMMLKRKFEKNLDAWLESGKILLVDGARQVGKTFLIEEYCRNNFPNFVEINLAYEKDAIETLENARNADDFIFVVSALSNKPLREKETAIFIDEIQLAPGIDFLTLSKALVLDGRYRFIFSGSLLGVTEFNVALEPTGFLYAERMYPLDYEEFLWANGVQPEVIDKLRECFQKREEVPSFLHQRMMDLFYKYLLVGGMPEAVASYVEKKDLPSLNIIYKAIEQHYVRDITKYSPPEDRVMIRMAYDLLPSQLNSKSKRFTLNKLGKRYKLERAENCFLWLSDAGIAIPTYNVDEPKTPLLLSKNSRLLKLFSGDCGLLSYRLMDTDIQRKLLAHEIDINYGAIFENFAAQELAAHGYDKIYYFASKKQGEVDFLISYKGDVLPIEIKSGKAYQRHVALDNLLSNEEYGIKQAFVFSGNNVSGIGRKAYFPIYMIGFLAKGS